MAATALGSFISLFFLKRQRATYGNSACLGKNCTGYPFAEINVTDEELYQLPNQII